MATDPIDYDALDEAADCSYWEYDPTLRGVAERLYPESDLNWARSRLSEFGEVLGHTVAHNADLIDENPPELHTYDDYGEVQNHVEYHPKQFENERITYEEFGLSHDVFHAPEGRDEPLNISHALLMQTYLSYADQGFTCPASMTVGAAIVLDKFDDGSLSGFFQQLTTDDYDDHIEGAMFLTEKQGGSDVGANETRAEPADPETVSDDAPEDAEVYRLYGEKWFCSNIDGQGALALARTPDAEEGTAGLSLFLVPHEVDGEPNGQLYRRLKDKLGTLSVPTGEIEFEGAEAYLVGEEERGFKYMAEMMNYERLSNAAASVSAIGRTLLAAKVRAADREAFGDVIQEYPLMRRDLVEMTVDYEAAAAFTFEAARLMDEREAEGDESEAYRLMRLLIPIAKYRTARMAVDGTSYAMEILGGNGYVSGFVTERFFRDAQVLPIWEGPSNVLSLDVLRALEREQAAESLLPYVQEKLDAVEHPHLEPLAEEVEAAFTDLQRGLGALAGEDGDYAQYQAKKLADLIFDVVTGALLLEQAQDDIERGEARRALVAEGFVNTRFRDESRHIDSGERFAMTDEVFDAVARYASVEPDALVDAPEPTADD
ncbi:acyl-CoA dehydrogenase family protein [Haloglomus litoreum]|uniref:acyl-CoA dehydrogenase family protein n=1 Tax=Haloglomus litoreum TaxID=3034026 RepID=UPI0023E81F36|nr:acyl-CoA dehydrogenase family protein [Haloglomus sp. DT116]